MLRQDAHANGLFLSAEPYSARPAFRLLISRSTGELLHMPNAGEGFTVISAMRHSQPAALTMLLSAFPDVKSAMEAIILEAFWVSFTDDHELL